MRLVAVLMLLATAAPAVAQSPNGPDCSADAVDALEVETIKHQIEFERSSEQFRDDLEQQCDFASKFSTSIKTWRARLEECGTKLRFGHILLTKSAEMSAIVDGFALKMCESPGGETEKNGPQNLRFSGMCLPHNILQRNDKFNQRLIDRRRALESWAPMNAVCQNAREVVADLVAVRDSFEECIPALDDAGVQMTKVRLEGLNSAKARLDETLSKCAALERPVASSLPAAPREMPDLYGPKSAVPRNTQVAAPTPSTAPLTDDAGPAPRTREQRAREAEGLKTLTSQQLIDMTYNPPLGRWFVVENASGEKFLRQEFPTSTPAVESGFHTIVILCTGGKNLTVIVQSDRPVKPYLWLANAGHPEKLAGAVHVTRGAPAIFLVNASARKLTKAFAAAETAERRQASAAYTPNYAFGLNDEWNHGGPSVSTKDFTRLVKATMPGCAKGI